MTLPQAEPQADPSGGILEEHIAITEDDSSVPVTALKTFQWNKIYIQVEDSDVDTYPG